MIGKQLKYAVIGAGNGGKAIAAHLALMGYDVALYNRTHTHIVEIQRMGGIHLQNTENGIDEFAKLSLVTSSLEKAIEGRQLLMIVVPANAHKEIAAKLSGIVVDRQMIILNPGRTFGALEFKRILKKTGCTANVIVAETQTFIYASRAEGNTAVRIFRIKNTVPLAALPARQTRKVLDALKPAFPQFIDGITTLHTGLNNIGAIFHPVISLLNAGRIEQDEQEFQFYIDGVTPTVARIMEAVDKERTRIALELGIHVASAAEWLKKVYDTSGDNLYETIQNQDGYRGIFAPNTLMHRYLIEDIPMSMVPLASLGKQLGMPVDGMESFIKLANIAHNTDYWQIGRTMRKMGIAHLGKYELLDYFRQGTEKLVAERRKTQPVYQRIPFAEPPAIGG